ncbi:MAG TPA: hypothetical protein VHP58_05930 [Alphaproteobacteria bacterium]|nr:hypothetical protein [Alphaproteobacteria bacterium]
MSIEIILSSITFPKTCRSTIGLQGVDELETVFLTRFRQLEIAQQPGLSASGGAEAEVGVYERANLYPYKLRPDTFYIDGYKLPQTSMLFARGADEGVIATVAEKLGEDLLYKWSHRDTSKNWEKFSAEQGGEAWIEDLFTKGCTIIPTFEAHNGYNVVSTDFELTDYWPGRAVLGLHSIVEMKPSKAPPGTILEVLEPGFVTATVVRPARVVISDGSRYVSPHGNDIVPMLPNLYLPHGRTIADWNSCWLPTHPGHFEEPALWGYDILDTGRFVQLSGPLWDPLHYYYASTDPMLRAFNTPGSANGSVKVPPEMLNRFYPMAAPEGFDTFDTAELQRRIQNNIYPKTAIVRHRNEKPGCDFGYHPLPSEYEYEFDPFWMPDQHPHNRGQGTCPENLLSRLAPVIIPPIGVQAYRQTLKVPEEAPWFGQEELLANASLDPVECFPQLARYVRPDLEPEQFLPLIPAPYLAQPRNELLTGTVQQVWEGMDEADDLYGIAAALVDVLPDAKEQGLAQMRYRHYVYRTRKAFYTLACWYGLSLEDITRIDTETEQVNVAAATAAGSRQGGRAAQIARAAAQASPAQPQRRQAAAQAATPVIRES